MLPGAIAERKLDISGYVVYFLSEVREMVAKVVCSNCGAHLGIKEVADIAGIDNPISHGICPPCVAKLYGEYFTQAEKAEERG
jgi:hypothetical protein